MNQHRFACRERLRHIARRAMVERGLRPDFSDEALDQLRAIPGAPIETGPDVRDLRDLAWCSIDNDDSRDLDQLSAAIPGPRGAKILIAIADVDVVVRKGTPIDSHARQNTTSIYTAAQMYPMLPEPISTDLTSLRQDVDRMAVVIELDVEHDGDVKGASICRAIVRNRAKLAYDAVAAWFEGRAAMPAPIAPVPGLEASLRLQDELAQRMRVARYAQGALALDSIESRPVFVGEILTDLHPAETNRAKQLIEEFMVAANGATARFLESKNFASLRRVLGAPKRWDRIVSLAAETGTKLPPSPDALALGKFLFARRRADPERFPDLSLSIVKLLGSGEYALEMPGEDPAGHFGLAVRDYTHSTAPNRRYPDLITQRMLKAALAGRPSPYSRGELVQLAAHCTEQEDDATKVERQVLKSAAAILLEDRIRERFTGFVTGVSDKGTWVRIVNPTVEGKVVHGFEGLDVGDKIRVELLEVDVERGFIDFAALPGS